MGKVQSAEWYNKYFNKKRDLYKRSPSESTVYVLYRDSAEWAIKQNLPVVDVGCGPGLLYSELREKGFNGIYRGVDFSDEALSIVESRKNPGDTKCELVNVDLETIKSFSPKRRRAFVVCETLEHLEHDLDLLTAIPIGSPVWFSVPDFDVASHVRKFASADEVMERYGKLFSVLVMDSIPIKVKGKVFHRYYIGVGVR
jgi:SAM-dependent methyltransferase